MKMMMVAHHHLIVRIVMRKRLLRNHSNQFGSSRMQWALTKMTSHIIIIITIIINITSRSIIKTTVMNVLQKISSRIFAK